MLSSHACYNTLGNCLTGCLAQTVTLCATQLVDGDNAKEDARIGLAIPISGMCVYVNVVDHEVQTWLMSRCRQHESMNPKQ